jgi:hypothetical protein
VKRAARFEFPARFLELYPAADNLDDIGARNQIVDKVLRD